MTATTRQVLVHAHIFKNAGTTFDASLRRCFGECFVDHRDDQAFLKDRNAYLLDYLGEHPQVQALSSHSLHFRITGQPGLTLHPVYFLRHPLARVWSVYRFEQAQTGVDTEGPRRAKELDLNRFVDWYLQEGSPATIRNINTIFLSGTGPSPDHMDDKYRAAAQYLASGQAHICLVERYMDSMLVLEEMLGNVFSGLDLAWVRRNVSTSKPSQPVGESVHELLDQLDPAVALKLHEGNEHDLALYHQANALLDARLADISDLERKRQALGERCQAL